jgi:hypothetical protein
MPASSTRKLTPLSLELRVEPAIAHVRDRSFKERPEIEGDRLAFILPSGALVNVLKAKAKFTIRQLKITASTNLLLLIHAHQKWCYDSIALLRFIKGFSPFTIS